MEALKPIIDANGGYLVHAHAAKLISKPFDLVIEHALLQQGKFVATLNGNVVHHPNVIDHSVFSVRSQNFFSVRPVGSVYQGFGRPPVT